MKDHLYKKMEPLFHLIEHKYEELNPLEMLIIQLARGNTFDMRVVGMEGIKRFRKDNPNCSITFKPNHVSEADFIILSLLFRENNMRVLIEGGSNLFIEDIDIFRDLMPKFVNPNFAKASHNGKMSIADYLSARGAFKVFREPVKIKNEDGSEIKIGAKEMLSLSRAYRFKVVKDKEMYITFPGYSYMKSGMFNILESNQIKTGRSYTGKFDGYHHLPFQMDIEAAFHSGVELYVVDVNMAYEPVMEDQNFIELIRLYQSGCKQREIYLKDLGYIINEFCKNRSKGDLSIKFGEPAKVETSDLKNGLLKKNIKKYSQKIADETYEKMLSMQPVFPANIYFTAFNGDFNKMPIQIMKERIDDIRDHLRKLMFGKKKIKIDLHYVLDYNNHIISADEIISRTFLKFNIDNRQITAKDGDMLVICRKDVAMQYKNHTAHYFEGFENVEIE